MAVEYALDSGTSRDAVHALDRVEGEKREDWSWGVRGDDGGGVGGGGGGGGGGGVRGELTWSFATRKRTRPNTRGIAT